MSNTFVELRKKHPIVRYRAFSYRVEGKELIVTFDFLLEPDITFAPTLKIQLPKEEQIKKNIDTLVFSLGLIELISYWKCACPPKIVIEAGSLRADQIAWWRDLYLHGLGEFFFRNNITPDPDSLVSFETMGPELAPLRGGDHEGDLILVGGGKDSALTLELFKNNGKRVMACGLDPREVSRREAAAASVKEFISATRYIDQKLLALNRSGYLNGHTPFSAYLAFFSVLVAEVYGLNQILVSNERSADEGNTHIGNLVVNHQYSKSLRFEERFREYSKKYLTEQISYFSVLRPLHDLQVTALFSQCEKQLSLFRSCNVNMKSDSWCNRCPKCAFVYLSLSPFLSPEKLIAIFGEDLFLVPEIQQHILSLTGRVGIKPFECVGTERESRAALAAIATKRELPSVFTVTPEEESLQKILLEWGEDMFIPKRYKERLLASLDCSLLIR